MKKSLLPLFAVALGLAPFSLEAQDWPEGLTLEGRVAFTEGPAWHAPSESVFFTDIENSRIMRQVKDGSFQVYRTNSGRANGLLFDGEGRLHACEGGNRRVTRTELDGTISVLAATFEGNPFNSPNDLVQAEDGSIYFTDPRYGDRSTMAIFDDEGKAVEGVYRIAPDGTITQVITHEVDRPNGIAIKDGYLFVADNVNSGPNEGVGGNRKLWRFELTDDGSVDRESAHCLYDWGTDRGPDGIVVGPDGLIYATAGFNFPKPPAETAGKHKAGVYVIDPESGEMVKFYAVPADMITNCTFGGTEGKTLYITAGHKLWSLRID